jgi:hypothetical protein
MSTADWVRLILKEMRRRMTVIIPTNEPKKMRARLYYHRRKLNAPWSFVLDDGALIVRKKS